MNKKQLREIFKKKRASITTKKKESASYSLFETLKADPSIQKATHICGYMAMKNEISLSPFLEWVLNHNKNLYLPRFQKNNYHIAQVKNMSADIVLGRYNIKEPSRACPEISAHSSLIDVWIVPGMAFTRFGNRLGMGLGVYDQLLVNAQGKKIGVAFSVQEATILPVDEWDICMDDVFFK
jgi:5-formyltetrahydrofolate cyclo-ligase